MNVRVIASLAATVLPLLGDGAMAQQSRVTISTAPKMFQAGSPFKIDVAVDTTGGSMGRNQVQVTVTDDTRMWLNDLKDLSGGHATFQLLAPKPNGRILTITAYVDGDIGDAGTTPWVGARRLVYQCGAGPERGTGKTTAQTNCWFRIPAELARE